MDYVLTFQNTFPTFWGKAIRCHFGTSLLVRLTEHFLFGFLFIYLVMGFIGQSLWSDEQLAKSKYKLWAHFKEADEALGHWFLVGFGAPGWSFCLHTQEPPQQAQPAQPAHPDASWPYFHFPSLSIGDDGATDVLDQLEDALYGDDFGLCCAGFKVPKGFFSLVTGKCGLKSECWNAMLRISWYAIALFDSAL